MVAQLFVEIQRVFAHQEYVVAQKLIQRRSINAGILAQNAGLLGIGVAVEVPVHGYVQPVGEEVKDGKVGADVARHAVVRLLPPQQRLRPNGVGGKRIQGR